MVDSNIFRRLSQLVPLLSRATLLELGAILYIIFSLCKTDNFEPLSKIVTSYNEFFPYGVILSYIIILMGGVRKITPIDLSHNYSQDRNNKNSDARFLHVCELKMMSMVQVPCDVVIGIRLFKILPEFIIDTLIGKINLCLIFDYFSDQIDLDVYSYGKKDVMIDIEGKRNKLQKRVLINNHLGKSEHIRPILILPKSYEDGKELIINLRLESVKSNKAFNTFLFILSYLSFSQKKMIIV